MADKEFWREWAKKKAVDDPSVRQGDPASWKNLSDEQRDDLLGWYSQQQIEEIEKRKKEDNSFILSSIFALIPFAVGYGFRCTSGELNALMIRESSGILILYSLVFSFSLLCMRVSIVIHNLQ